MTLNKRTVLVAISEQSARERIGQELGSGYSVLLARDGVDAAIQYERCATRITAVITDLLLARFGGDVLAAWLHHINPQLPIIIMTSGAEGDELSVLREYPEVRLIKKPVGRRRLKALLDATV